MSRVLVLKEKWDTIIKGPYETDEELEEGARKVVERRLNDGFWYTDEDSRFLAEAIRVGNPPDGWTAMEFLYSRSNYEYEEVYTDIVSR